MSEPESLNTDEPLPERIERHAFDRLIMLSDGVFAIAITLLALEIRPPEGWTGGLDDLLFKTWRALFGFGMSFLIIGVFWVANRRMVARLRRVDGPYTALTLLLLCLVCLTPSVTALMADYGPTRSMKVYAVLVAAAGFAQAMLWGYAAFVGRLIDDGVSLRERRIVLLALVIFPMMFCYLGLVMGSGVSVVAYLPVMVVAVLAGQLRRRALRGS